MRTESSALPRGLESRQPVRSALSEMAATLRRDRTARTVVALLVAANLGLLALATLRLGAMVAGDLDNPLFNEWLRVDADNSLPELLQYAEAFAAAGLLALAARLRGESAYAAWAVVFLFVAADDVLKLRALAGPLLTAALDLPRIPGLQPGDTGELLVWTTSGIALLAGVAASLRSASRLALSYSLVLLAIFVVLVVCGMGVDVLQTEFGDRHVWLRRLLRLAEEGGEMVAIAAAAAVSLLLVRSTSASAP